jgi:hypothetical protein
MSEKFTSYQRPRVLFFAYYFPPMGGMGSLRARGFARHLPEAGTDLTVIAPRTGTYGHDRSLDLPPGAEVIRTGTLEPGVLLRPAWRAAGAAPPAAGPARAGGRLRRALGWLLHVPDANVGWVPCAAAAGIASAARRRPDVVLSSSPPLSAHLAGAIVAARLRLPHVLDVRDMPRFQRVFAGPRGRIDAALFGRVLRSAAGVCSTSGIILADIAPRTSAPVLLVRNGYDEEDFAGPSPRPADGTFTVVHAGSTYGSFGNHPPLLAAVRGLLDRGIPLRLRFVGVVDGPLREAMRPLTGAGSGPFEVTGFVSHHQALSELRSAGAVLLMFWGDGPAGTVVPGKTFECLRAGPPVLALGPPGCEGERLLAGIGGARFVDITDEAAIAGALADFAAGRTPPRPDPDRLRAFTRRAQAARLSDWLSGLIESRR